MSKCKSCGAEILFMKTELGKWMPLDPEPTYEGNVMINRAEDTCSVVTDFKLLESLRGRLYLSHFKSCPNADEHRRPVRKDLA